MRLLHCTDVLPKIGLEFVPPDALYRGSWVHRACHLAATGKLDAEAAQASAPDWWGYVEAHWKFLREKNARVIVSECRIGGPALGYVGTLDEVIDSASTGLSVVDLKCGPAEWWHGLQIAAYEHAYRTERKIMRKMRRFSLHLSADGNYDLTEHKGKDDLRDFLAYLRIAYREIKEGAREWPAKREGEE